MARGTIEWVNRDQGYGFISPDDGPENVLFLDHAQTLLEGADEGGRWAPEEGERVVFDMVRGARGKLAVSVLRQRP